MKNRVISVILALSVIICLFTSCKANKNSASEIAKEQAATIIECLKTGKTEELKALFCEEVSSTHDLDKEIQEAIGFIDGEIVDDGTWVGMTEGGKSIENGVVTKSDINASMVDITTTTQKKYIVSFLSYLVYSDSKQRLGITYITIKREDGTVLYMIGEIIY